MRIKPRCGIILFGQHADRIGPWQTSYYSKARFRARQMLVHGSATIFHQALLAMELHRRPHVSVLCLLLLHALEA